MDEVEQIRHYTHQIHGYNGVDGEDDRRPANKHLDRFFPDDIWRCDVFAHLFTFLASHHANAEHHRLLNNHHQDGWDEEGGEAALGVKHRDVFVFNRILECCSVAPGIICALISLFISNETSVQLLKTAL